jgi:hypothetical protein
MDKGKEQELVQALQENVKVMGKSELDSLTTQLSEK